MVNLTKKDLEQVLDKRLKGLAGKKDLEPITQTLARTTGFLAKLGEDFKDFREDMKHVPGTLNDQTTTIDAIYKNTEISKTETTSIRAAIKRHEGWISKLADKVGISLEGLK